MGDRMENDRLIRQDVVEPEYAVNVGGPDHQIDVVVPGNQLTIPYGPQEGAIGQGVPDPVAPECAMH